MLDVVIRDDRAFCAQRAELIEIDPPILQIIRLLDLDILEKIWNFDDRQFLLNLFLEVIFEFRRSFIGGLRCVGRCARLRDLGVVIVITTILDSQRNVDLCFREFVVLLENIVVVFKDVLGLVHVLVADNL
jgi:hypothetical protein